MSPHWWQDFLVDAVTWYLWLSILAWLVYPWVFRAASCLPDRGLVLARVVGPIMVALLSAWFSYALPRSEEFLGLHIAWAPGGRSPGVVAALSGMLLLFVGMLPRSWTPMTRFLRGRWKVVLGIEAAFAGLFVLHLWLRSWTPDATFDALGWFGAEKWPNLTILSHLWRNDVIPPLDPWLAGQELNYYYFSHLTWAGVARLAAVTPEVAFNLALATVFALGAMGAFSAGWAMGRRVRAGLWAAFLVALAGPPRAWAGLETVVTVWRNRGWSEAPRLYDFWAPSDVIPDTRNEFPAFNALLGDLHAHGWGLVLALGALMVVVHLGRVRRIAGGPGWRELLALQSPAWLLLLVLMGAMWATNGWDLAVFGLLAAGWVALETLGERRGGGEAPAVPRGAVATQLVQGLLVLIVLAAAATAVTGFYSWQTYLPVNVHVEWLAGLPSALGVLGAIGRVAPGDATTVGQWVAFWGFFAAAACAAGFCPALRSGRLRANSPALAAVALAAWGFALVPSLVPGIPRVGFGLLLALTGVVWLLWRDLWRADSPWRWPLLLTAVALVCQAIPEIVFVDDPIGPPYDRYNTVFKLYYPAWALWGLALGVLLAEFGRGRPESGEGGEPHAEEAPPMWRRAVAPAGRVCLLAAVLAACGLYPLLGAASRVAAGIGRMERLERRGLDSTFVRRHCRTLNALAFMHLPDYAPDDLRLALWMRRNLPRDAVLVESSSVGSGNSAGSSYTMAGRMAAISGAVCVMGWQGHQAQWRGSAIDTLYAERSNLIESIYRERDPDAVRALCRDWGLRWIVVGQVERGRYGEDTIDRLAEVGEVACRYGDSVLYRVDIGR